MFEGGDPGARRHQLSLGGIDFFLALRMGMAFEADATPLVTRLAPFPLLPLLRNRRVGLLHVPLLQTAGHADAEERAPVQSRGRIRRRLEQPRSKVGDVAALAEEQHSREDDADTEE